MIAIQNQNQNRCRPRLFADSPALSVQLGRQFYYEASAMAGDWIKMRHDLGDDPAVITLVALTSCVDAEHVIGKLHKLWSWADRQSRNGHAPGVTAFWLDWFLHCDGFAKVLEKVGWLRITDKDIVIPKFDRHVSKSAKNRALAAQRKVTQRSRNDRDKSVTREEKRREETSLDRSIDSNDRRTLDSIDWKETTIIANRLHDKIKAAWSGFTLQSKYRTKFLAAAALVQCGLMPEGILADAVDSMILKRRRSPAGYLGKVLADKFPRWDILRAAVTLPGKEE